MIPRQTHLIPLRLRKELDAMAAKYRAQGVRLFIFGSLAETYPRSYRGADLDLGYEAPMNKANMEELERRLRRDADSLPTVRPIDLVDFTRVSKDFASEAKTRIIELPKGE